ncbi:MAG: glycerol-3-phosphate 1-O-acyltransferase PlsY [Candidatus Dormiibacterota bacterium]
MIPAILLAAAAYLVGSIPTGLWLGRTVGGIDVRRSGSHRTGATNVQRALGTRAGVAVLAIDFVKGLGVVVATRAITGNDYVAAAAGLAAVLGHIFPVFAGFRGGRGVATGAGAICGLAPLAVLLAFATLALVVALTRYVSLGSVIGALSAPIWVLALRGRTPQSDAALPLAIATGALVVLAHADNIYRLMRGRESRLGQKPSAGA